MTLADASDTGVTVVLQGDPNVDDSFQPLLSLKEKLPLGSYDEATGKLGMLVSRYKVGLSIVGFYHDGSA